ncbi:hypothetical protein ACM46_04435 [Chryseobacterium angstadtii]|uniref:Glycerophosphoryl diester phosphodiesterase membrane domain-containing protein n=1 Tax=Chryseobacterium angstadtii TaxID=558151 RepID=A0A0J7IKC7_9FLAO|nr:DUF4013 domain-containing protein [Chryseobacterium angstadtii]KMQ66758.1 hypothetical protein ACM46_04435 [Chryseobacterium angstadtii]
MNNLEIQKIKDYDFNIGKYLSQGTELFKKDIGGFIVATLLLFVMSFIPFCSILGLGNFYKICKKVDEGEQVSAGDIFDFTDFVVYLKLFLLIFAICIVLMIPVQISLIPLILAAGNEDGNMSDTGTALFAGGMGLWMILLFVLLTVLSISMYFVQPLISLHRMTSVTEAFKLSWKIARKNFFKILLFSIVVGFISQLGIIVCGIGVLFSIPLGICMKYAAYKDTLGSINQKMV